MPTEPKPNFLSIASALVGRGFAVTPLKGKAAFLTGTDYGCSRDADQIKRWAEEYPSSNCGVVVVGQDYWAADIDHLDWFMDHAPGPLPKTLVVKTGSGKYHIYFKGRRPSGLKAVKNPAWTKESPKTEPQKLFEFPNQCVGVGSVHPGTSRTYEPVEGYDLPLAECPAEWLAFFKRNIREPKSSVALKPRPLKAGLTLEQVLDSTSLAGKYERFDAADRVFLNYAKGLGYCLIRGDGSDSHFQPGEQINGRQCGFYYMKADPSDWGHQCFSCGCGNRKAALAGLGVEFEEILSPRWREGFKSFGQMSEDSPRFLLHNLIPERALTLVCAPSFNGKTWLVMQACLALSQGQGIWGFEGPSSPAPVSYHVPEMDESRVRHYAAELGAFDSENFLFRPMESGLWGLNDSRMVESSKGRLVVLDTQGFFNPADETSSYQQALKFGSMCFELLTSGCLGIIGLYHPPKYSSQENLDWTLENSILGSAGYGGILRSCLRVKNLNPDLNVKAVHLYVQGLKNPDLKPFQLSGPPPLRVKANPSPYLRDILSGPPPKEVRAAELVRQKQTNQKIQEQLAFEFGSGLKASKLSEIRKDIEDPIDATAE